MIIQFLNFYNSINEKIFSNLDNYITSIYLPEWFTDAILDSLHILPFLFVVFVIIEIVEYFLANKINNLIKTSEKYSILLGSTLAIIPQCGFSIIATSLYFKRYLTKGALIAIYLATSDEAIPILLSQPNTLHYIIPIISIKILVAISAGYLIDFILKDNKYIPIKENIEEHSGCCHHSIDERHSKELIIHPIKHTINIFSFILLITILLNFFINICLKYSFIHNLFHNLKYFAPVFTSIIGLIPNCAISVGLTMLLINGTLNFSSVIAGLLSNAGLGILILFKDNKNLQDSTKIISILLCISIVIGLILQIFNL